MLLIKACSWEFQGGRGLSVILYISLSLITPLVCNQLLYGFASLVGILE
jgi:hypothetical protein